MKLWGRNLPTVSFFIILAIPLFATSQVKEEELTTYGFGNGKAWEILDWQSKICELTGIEEGMKLFLSELSVRTSDKKEIDRFDALWHELTIRGFRFSDLVPQVDKFYEDRSNIRIPIAYAYFFAIKKMSGTNLKDLDEYVSQLRKVWNK